MPGSVMKVFFFKSEAYLERLEYSLKKLNEKVEAADLSQHQSHCIADA